MNPFDPHAYGPLLAPLLAGDRRRPLGAGLCDPRATVRLREMSVEAAFAHTTLADVNMADCCLAGLWLLHDFLAESHTISQRIETPSGRFWHAIMHRREGDYSNSKYWLRRVGRHEVLQPLGHRAAELAAIRGDSQAIGTLITSGQWDAFAYVDLVESVEQGRRADTCELCLDIQQAEWELLFDWCYRRAARA